jgi:DNA-binding response OmpR family regulator
MRSSNSHAVSSKSAQRVSLKAVSGKIRVLIADDDRAVSRGLANYFNSHGFEAKVVSSVAEAKEAIEFWHPHSIFVDLMLPASNALSLLRFINTKSLKTKPDVVVMSRQAFPDGIAQARKAGASHYMVKPFTNEDAFQAVMSHRLQDPPPAPAVTSAALPDRERQEESAPEHHSMLTELHLLNLILKQAAQPGTARQRYYNLMRMISMKTKALRCSLVRCVNEDTGEVAASNDD